MLHLRRSLRAALLALVVAVALVGVTPIATDAAKLPDCPTLPTGGGPRDGDPDMPEWNSQAPRHSTASALRGTDPRTPWSEFWSLLVRFKV